MELLNQFEKCYPEINKIAKELCEFKIEKKPVSQKLVTKKSLFVDHNIINIIPYHCAPSLVLIKYIDLPFLLFIAANKYLKKLFDYTFVITPKCIFWFVVIFVFWLYFLFFFYCFYSIDFGSAFWLTNKFHSLTYVIWCTLCSVCYLTVDGWRQHIVLWKWFARSGKIGYQWRIWGNYFP